MFSADTTLHQSLSVSQEIRISDRDLDEGRTYGHFQYTASLHSRATELKFDESRNKWTEWIYDRWNSREHNW